MLSVLVGLLAIAPAQAKLDPSFGKRGKVTTPVPLPRTASEGGVPYAPTLPKGEVHLAWAGGGKFLVAGQRTVARYLPSGRLDERFGSGGKLTLTVSLGSADLIRGLAVDSAGRIVLALGAENSSSVTLRRYLPGGAPDASFGSGGTVGTDLGLSLPHFEGTAIPWRPPVAYQRPLLTAGGLTTDALDRPVLTGSWAERQVICYPFTNYTLIYSPYVARFRVDGSLDAGYGSGGVARQSEFGVEASQPLATPSGGLLYVGAQRPECQRGVVANATLVSLDGTGARDTSFGRGGGAAQLPGEPELGNVAPAVTTDRAGHIFAATSSVLQRFSPRGHPSPRFGGDPAKGTVSLENTWFSGTPGLAVDGRGRAVVATVEDVEPVRLGDEREGFCFLVIRRLADGRADRGFGKKGRIRTVFPGTAVPQAVLIGRKGKPLVAGWTESPQGYGFALARYQGG